MWLCFGLGSQLLGGPRVDVFMAMRLPKQALQQNDIHTARRILAVTDIKLATTLVGLGDRQK